MSTLLQDLRYAARLLLKDGAFTAAAVATLALGVGANATVFSWVNAVLLDPLPGVPESHRLAGVQQTARDGSPLSLSYPDYVDLSDRNDVLEGLIAYDIQAMNLSGDRGPERVWGMIVSGNYFDVLGVKALHGRTFLPEEDRTPGTHPVVVVSHSLWRRRFGGDPAIVGSTIALNNRSFTLVGVTPDGFRGTVIGLDLEAWVPLMMQRAIVEGGDRLTQQGNHWLDGMARLRPGVSRDQAQAQLTTLARTMIRDRGADPGEAGTLLSPLSRLDAAEVMGPVLLVLLAVVGVVLLVACANLANLMLARGAARGREAVVRAALGAGRSRLLRQHLTESLLLSALGCAAAWVTAHWGAGLLTALVPPTGMPLGLAVRLDGRVFVFTLAASVACGLLFGLGPAVQAARANLAGALKEGSSPVAGGRTWSRLRRGLVVAQVSLSVLLLVCAGLLLRSLQKARTFDPGFDPRGVLLASIDLFPAGYDEVRGPLLLRRILSDVRALPGVEDATVARKIPLSLSGTSSTSLEVEGHSHLPEESPWAFYNVVGPDYFRTMRVPLTRGRDLALDDGGGSAEVVVVNETFARRYGGGDEAAVLGRRVDVFGRPRTIVGVARDMKHRRLDEPPAPHVFLPVLQYFRPDATLHVRGRGRSLELAAPVQREVHRLDPDLPVFGTRDLEASLGAAMFPQRLGGLLLATFGLLALAMATVGLYAVQAYAITRRWREIGIRMTLGARPRDVLGMVVGQGMRMASLGTLIGLAAALPAGRLLSGLLFGVAPADPLTLAAVPGVLLAVALVGSWLPARRAARVDPMRALRCD